MNHTMLEFVKDKLEEGEGISPSALSSIVAAAKMPVRRHYHWRIPALLAASFAVAACGWFMVHDLRDDAGEGDLANTIDLLRLADGGTVYDGDSLIDNLIVWQDAPATVTSAK